MKVTAARYVRTYHHVVNCDTASAALRRFDEQRCTCDSKSVYSICAPHDLGHLSMLRSRARSAYIRAADHHNESGAHVIRAAIRYADAVQSWTGDDYPSGWELTQRSVQQERRTIDSES